jgi:hypothetical protein
LLLAVYATDLSPPIPTGAPPDWYQIEVIPDARIFPSRVISETPR